MYSILTIQSTMSWLLRDISYCHIYGVQSKLDANHKDIFVLCQYISNLISTIKIKLLIINSRTLNGEMHLQLKNFGWLGAMNSEILSL